MATLQAKLSINGREQKINMYTSGELAETSLADLPSSQGAQGQAYVDVADILGDDDSADSPGPPPPGPESRHGSGEPSTSHTLPAISGAQRSKPASSRGGAAPPKSRPQHQHLPAPQRQAAGSQSSSPGRNSNPRTSWSPTSQRSSQQLVPGEKPKPRARHDLTGIDPAYVATAAYRKKAGVGVVYDWKTQHETNNMLLKQRKESERTEKVLEAARRQIQARQENDYAFQAWLDEKRQVKVKQVKQVKQVVSMERIYKQMAQDDPYEQQQREREWVPNFASKYDAASIGAQPAARPRGNKFKLGPGML